MCLVFGSCGLENLSSKCSIGNYEMGLKTYESARSGYFHNLVATMAFIRAIHIFADFYFLYSVVYFGFVVWGITGERTKLSKSTTYFVLNGKTTWFCRQDNNFKNPSPRTYLHGLLGQIMIITMDPEV